MARTPFQQLEPLLCVSRSEPGWRVSIFYTTWASYCKVHSWRKISRWWHVVKGSNLTVVTPDMLCYIPPAPLVKKANQDPPS